MTVTLRLVAITFHAVRMKTLSLLLIISCILAGCVIKDEIAKPELTVSFRVSGDHVSVMELQSNFDYENEELFIDSFKEGFADRLNTRPYQERRSAQGEETTDELGYGTGYSAALFVIRATQGEATDGMYMIKRFPREPNSMASKMEFLIATEQTSHN